MRETPDILVESEPAAAGRNQPGLWQRLLARYAAPGCCLLSAALIVTFLAPPPGLVEFTGSDVWSRLGMGVVVFLALHALLIVTGHTTGKAILPFGVSVESGPQAGVLSEELLSLRRTDERVFERIGELHDLVQSTIYLVKRLEDRLGEQ